MSVKVSFPAKVVRPLIRHKLEQLERDGYLPKSLGNTVGAQHEVMTARVKFCTDAKISVRTLDRVMKEITMVKLVTADRLAIGLGYHIGDIWPEYYDE